MIDQIKNAVLALQNGDTSVFKEKIGNVLMSKAIDMINLQKISTGQSIFEPAKDDEASEYDLSQNEDEPPVQEVETKENA